MTQNCSHICEVFCILEINFIEDCSLSGTTHIDTNTISTTEKLLQKLTEVRS